MTLARADDRRGVSEALRSTCVVDQRYHSRRRCTGAPSSQGTGSPTIAPMKSVI